jgi:hypothetical protein
MIKILYITFWFSIFLGKWRCSINGVALEEKLSVHVGLEASRMVQNPDGKCSGEKQMEARREYSMRLLLHQYRLLMIQMNNLRILIKAQIGLSQKTFQDPFLLDMLILQESCRRVILLDNSPCCSYIFHAALCSLSFLCFWLCWWILSITRSKP